MRLILVEPPSGSLLTAAEAKARLGLGDEVSDDIVDAFVAAASQQIDGADGWLGRALLTQTWRMTMPEFCERIRIPLPPLQDVLAVSYVAADGVSVEVDSADYSLIEGQRPYITPAYRKFWPATRCQDDAVSIEFIVGYGAAEDVPEPIRTAVCLQVRQLFSLASRDAGLTQRIVNGVSSRSWALDGGAAGVAALDLSITSLLSIYRVYS